MKDSTGMLGSLEGAVQLDITKEALKDFTYDWSRLTFDGEKDKLVMSLQIMMKN